MFCILSRIGVSATIKESYDEMGAGQYGQSLPFAEKHILPKLAPKAKKLRAFIKKLVTPKLLQEAVAEHAAYMAAQKRAKNNQPELFAATEEKTA